MNKKYLIFFLLFLAVFGTIIPASANESIGDGSAEAVYKQSHPVTFTATVPEELASNYDKVSIQLVPDEGLPRMVYVAKQHDWTFTTNLPEGNYIVYSADVPNDINEPFKIDEQLTFSVPTNDTIVINVVSSKTPNKNTDNNANKDDAVSNSTEITNDNTATDAIGGAEDKRVGNDVSDDGDVKDAEKIIDENDNHPSVIPIADTIPKDGAENTDISNGTTRTLCFIAFLIGMITSSVFWIFILKKYRNNQY